MSEVKPDALERQTIHPDDTETRDKAARAAVRSLREEITRADVDTMRLLVTEARTHYGWQDRDVSNDTLREIYDIARMAPTSMNIQPMRLIFVRSGEAKKRLEPLLVEGNRPKTMSAPVTAIVGFDTRFFDRMAEVFPPNPDAGSMWEGNEDFARETAFRNGTIQGAFFIIAARSVGLDCGPMSGFDNDGVDKEFFAGTTVKSNFLCNLGYANEEKIFRRLPRLPFDDVARVI